MSDNSKSNNTASKQTKNTIIIEVVTIILLLAIVIFFISKITKNNNSSNNASATQAISSAVAAVVVNGESGNQTDVFDGSISFRDVDFSSTIDEIKEIEANSNETLDNPNVATSNDGYTYLTYTLNLDASPSLYNCTVTTNALLVYVFHNDNLIEIRWQYGALPKTDYTSIVSTITSQYGDATYSRTYSNGSLESWWKTDKNTLDIIYQDTGIYVYFRLNN